MRSILFPLLSSGTILIGINSTHGATIGKVYNYQIRGTTEFKLNQEGKSNQLNISEKVVHNIAERLSSPNVRNASAIIAGAIHKIKENEKTIDDTNDLGSALIMNQNSIQLIKNSNLYASKLLPVDIEYAFWSKKITKLKIKSTEISIFNEVYNQLAEEGIEDAINELNLENEKLKISQSKDYSDLVCSLDSENTESLICQQNFTIDVELKDLNSNSNKNEEKCEQLSPTSAAALAILPGRSSNDTCVKKVEEENKKERSCPACDVSRAILF